MGWNSWDSYQGSPTEAQFRDTAAIFDKILAPHGYEFLVIDAGWYDINSTTVATDGQSRLVPSANLWPSSVDGAGFKPIVDFVHSMGLKFGFHVMRGIHKQVVEANQPIAGTSYTAQDIAVESDNCPWWNDWYGVNMSHPAGPIYYQSIVDLYASWGADFIKVDCIFAQNFHEQDIIAISKSIQNSGADITFSLSPGGSATLQEAQQINQYVNQYRITQDFWDCWTSGPGVCGWASTILTHLTIFPQFESMIGASGLNGSSWPDGDMLPFGYIEDPGSGKPNYTRLTQDEQYTVMTLWSMFRSPLIFGGDVTRLDNFTTNLLTNDEVLEIQKSSTNNQLSSYSTTDTPIVLASGANGVQYAAIFNPSETTLSTNFQFSWADVTGTCSVRDLWAQSSLGSFATSFPVQVPVHGTGLYAISGCT